MKIIGITGTLGAGKGAIVVYLVSKGFKHYSAREFLIEEVKKRGLPVNRDTTTMVADSLRREHSPGYIIEQLYERAKNDGGNAVIESVRALGEVEFLRNQPDFYLFGVDADPRIRYTRIQKRKSQLDDVSYEKFLADEAREISDDPTRGNLLGCIKKADFVFINDGSIPMLYAQVDKALSQIL
jgi:dephospho-CoA kinase